MCAVFVWFMILQFNDVDAWVWIALYGSMAILCALAAAGRPQRSASVAAGLIQTVWAVVLFMQTTGAWWDGEVEREVGGLIICALWSFMLARDSR
jgi:hypothetical protein